MSCNFEFLLEQADGEHEYMMALIYRELQFLHHQTKRIDENCLLARLLNLAEQEAYAMAKIGIENTNQTITQTINDLKK